jgi:hypothetical protein
MNQTLSWSARAAILSGMALLGFACGENIAPPPTDLTPYLPQNLSAVSLDVRTVGLAWELPANVDDTVLVGYVVDVGGQQSAIGKRETTFVASSLAQGVTLFSVSPLGAGGATAPGPSISWAPAERFDSSFVIYEYNVSELARSAGLDVGTRLTDPVVVPVAYAVQQSMDMWLNGDAGQPLRLMSANLWLSDWNVTLFSSLITPAPSLDVAIPAFPAPSTFTESLVQLQDNTIYYAICEGDLANERHYARIHVHILPGSFPNRSIQIQLSLQRQPGVPFAGGADLPGNDATPDGPAFGEHT